LIKNPSGEIMKRLIPIVGLLLSLTFGATNVLGAAVPKAKEVRIAIQPSLALVPIFIVKQKHWLEDELTKDGITVKWSSFVSGPPENESFAAGQQDIGFIGDTPAIIGRSAGLNTRVVGVASVGPKTQALVVPKSSAIKTVADLRGKRVGVTKGSTAHHLLYLLLEKTHLTVNDIKLIHLPPADLVNAFNHGDLDAAATWEPFLGKLEENGARRIADGTGVKQNLCPIFVRQEFASANPELVQKVLKVYQRAYRFAKTHPQETAQLAAVEVKLPPEQVLRLIGRFDYDPMIRPVDVEELKKTEEFLRANNLSRSRVDIDAFVDTRYLK
jgi:sulfonate transport system substrate-binding protein